MSKLLKLRHIVSCLSCVLLATGLVAQESKAMHTAQRKQEFITANIVATHVAQEPQ